MRSFLILGFIVLAGCAGKPTVSENQCRAGDWQTIGVRDGAQGLPSTHLLQHQEACGEHGIVPNRDLYLAGWHEGVAQYCTTDNGFVIGQRGHGHNNVCTNDGFLNAYADGRELYLARQEVRRLENQLIGAENRIKAIKQEIIGATTAQLAPDLIPEERIALAAKVEALVEERSEIKHSIPVLEEELALSRARLDRLTQTLAYID